MAGFDLQGETEQSLVEALQQGRKEMMDLLFDAYAPVMLGVIIRIIPDKELAEEVLYETFIAIWTRIGVYDASQNRFLTWGLAIARGLALEAVRCGRVARLTEQNGQNGKVIGKVTENKTGVDLFAGLELQVKTVLELIYLKGRTCNEVASELGITTETIKASLKKAFVQLKAGKSV